MVMEKRKNSSSGSIDSFVDSGSLVSTDSYCSSNGYNEIINSDKLQFDNNNCTQIPGVVSVKNSSDVVIGPVTQFHGPVTILQRGDTLQNSKIVFKDNATVNDNCLKGQVQVERLVDSKCKILSKKEILWPLIILIVLLVIAIVSCVIVWGVVGRSDSFELDNDNGTGNVTLGGKYNIFEKSTWGGYKSAFEMEKLVHPTTFAVICHTATTFVSTFKDCSTAILNMQGSHINNGQPDIYYNFLVCGDANIYVGRGWDYNNGRMNDSIQIAFVGNYITDQLTDDMAYAAQLLVALGVKNKKLSSNYVLVGHNQTFKTDSPGKNVFKIISHWPHFFNGSVVNGQLVP